MENTSKSRKPNAQWDPTAAKIFNEICVEQVLANNRPQGCLNNKGYANLIAQFNERTGRNYNRSQMKNRWDALKNDYTTWKTLLLAASGLGRDPRTGSIAADDGWWKEKIEVCNVVLGSVILYFHGLILTIRTNCVSGHARMQKI
jgi:hypothetical protein